MKTIRSYKIPHVGVLRGFCGARDVRWDPVPLQMSMRSRGRADLDDGRRRRAGIGRESRGSCLIGTTPPQDESTKPGMKADDGHTRAVVKLFMHPAAAAPWTVQQQQQQQPRSVPSDAAINVLL